MKRILLLSAYDAGSHRRWRQALVAQFPEYCWTCLTLPPRYFSWRVRGNPLSWACGEKKEIIQQGYDLVLATSLVDLATLRGLIPSLAATPAVVYFHENQFAYPPSKNQQHTLEAKMVNLYSALCADAVVFNSRYNRESFFAGLTGLFNQLPDQLPRGIAQALREKSSVIPVPLERELFDNTKPPSLAGPKRLERRLEIVWNHRWEYDKGPDRLLACIQCLPRHLPLRFHVIGQQFRRNPDCFDTIKHELLDRDWHGEWGFITDRDHYWNLLRRVNIVLSTALHDFQGLSILDAVALGCVPLLPDRLAYKDLFSHEYLYSSYPESLSHEAQNLAEKILTLTQNDLFYAPDVSHLSWSVLRTPYEALISRVVNIP